MAKDFFLPVPAYDSASNCLTLFEVVFMETAGYIIVGAVCERITFWAFLLCELFIGAILYPISGCWTWGGGWLSQVGSTLNLGHGYVDFAGSSVVHAVGGFCAMALAIILGPRLGKYGPGGKIRVFPAHNIVYVVTGTFILLFGWMGFNPGSTLGATDLRISVVAVNTNLAAVAGSAAAMLVWYFWFGKPDITMACNGMLAGLVAITAPCAFVSPTSSVVIGVLAGCLVCGGVLFNERVLKIDDPCGAISVHGYCGWLGAVSVGIFADGAYGAGWNGVGATSYLGRAGQGVTGLIHGDTRQFLVPAYGSNSVRSLGVRCNLRRLLVRQQSEEHARSAGSGRRRPRRSRVWDAGLSRRCGGHAVLRAEGVQIESMAERKGFEPLIPFQVCRFSRPEPSTTRPPLRLLQFYYSPRSRVILAQLKPSS